MDPNFRKKENSNNLFLFEHYISSSVFRPFLVKYERKITILVYHNIPSSTTENELQVNSVKVDEFDRQMRFLRDNSFEVIPLSGIVSNLLEGKKLNKKTVVITFDDGYRTTFTNALPILKKYSIPATVFLATKYIDTHPTFPWLNSNYGSPYSEDLTPMNWDEVKKLHKSGIEIGSHTYSHPFLPKLSKQELENEILQSQADIENIINQKASSFAVPFSFPFVHWRWHSFKSTLLKVLKKGEYKCCCTLIRGHISRKTNPFFLRRIVIGKFDDLQSLHAKLIGGYAWTRIPQLIFQTFIKQYNM